MSRHVANAAVAAALVIALVLAWVLYFEMLAWGFRAR
jgi:hypothetical protein